MAGIAMDPYSELPCEMTRKIVNGLPTYSECPKARRKALTILFVASESKESIVQSVRRRMPTWKVGFGKRCTVSDIGKAFTEGGEYAAKLSLAMAEETHAIQESCDGYQGGACFMPYLNVRKSEFQERIRKTRFEIFHFSGHCHQTYGLSLCPDPKVSVVSMEDSHLTRSEFTGAFRHLNHKMDVAFIASCRSADFARALVDEKLATVSIGMKNDAKDPCIVEFVHKFYKRLLVSEYGFDAQSLVLAAQRAFAAASAFVLKKDCDVCIFPEPIAANRLKVRMYQSVQPFSSKAVMEENANAVEYRYTSFGTDDFNSTRATKRIVHERG